MAMGSSRGARPALLQFVASAVPSVVFPALACAADAEVPNATTTQVDAALRSLHLVAAVLLVLILAAVAVILYRKAFGSAGTESAVSPGPAETRKDLPDPLAQAELEEQSGNFVAAAGHYEAAGAKLRAAVCWERIKDFARAAECYEDGGELEHAAQLHLHSGAALRAAGIYMQTRNYLEAAKIFRNKGDHLRAAQALESYGNKLAAAREYTAAGNHALAARLLEEERLYAEAADAYHPLLDSEVTAENANRFSTYAALLALAGDRERAVQTYRSVLAAAPDHLRAISALQALGSRAPQTAPGAASGTTPIADTSAYLAPEDAEIDYLASGDPPPQTLAAPVLTPPAPEDLAIEIEIDGRSGHDGSLRRVFTLRSMIKAGRMEPRYSMRLWVQVMRALAERHRTDPTFGCIDPDAILIDMENNVRIQPTAACHLEYRAPEVVAGQPPDRQSDIYSMGVILYELVTGSLAHLGSMRAGEQFRDVPPWLDELIERCTEHDVAKRFRTAEEVSAALLKLKNAAQG